MPVRPTESDSDKHEKKGESKRENHPENNQKREDSPKKVKSNAVVSNAKQERSSSVPNETKGNSVLSISPDAKGEKNDFLQFKPVFKRLKDLPRRSGAAFRTSLRAKEARHEDGKARVIGEKANKRRKGKKKSNPLLFL